ncbi:MAG: hypothetical protein AAF998_10540 [Bacteroidota bacterium]
MFLGKTQQIQTPRPAQSARSSMNRSMSALAYETGRMTEELSKARIRTEDGKLTKLTKADMQSLILNAETRPAQVRKYIDALEIDSTSRGHIRKCITNINKLAKKIRPLQKKLAAVSMNGPR